MYMYMLLERVQYYIQIEQQILNNYSYFLQTINLIQQLMHQSRPQSDSHLNIFDPNISTQAKNAYSIDNIKGNYMIIDKETKSSILSSTKRNGKIILPNLQAKLARDNPAYRFLNIQIYLFAAMDWQITLQFVSSAQVKSYVMFSSKIKQEQKKFYTLKYPCPQNLKFEGWINLVIDLHNFMSVFRKSGDYDQQQELSFNQICITGFFKLRRIFAFKELGSLNKNIETKQKQHNNENHDGILIPSTHSFPLTTKHQTILLKPQYNTKQNNASSSTYPESTTQPNQYKMPRIVHPLRNSPINTNNTQVVNTDRVGMSSKSKVKFNLGNKIRVSNDREHYRKNSQDTVRNKVLLSPIQQKLKQISKSDLVSDNPRGNKENKSKWKRRRLIDAHNTVKKENDDVLTKRTSVTSNTNRYTHNLLDSETQNNLESIVTRSNNYSRFSSMCDPSDNSSGQYINLGQQEIMEQLQYENSLLYNETAKFKNDNAKNIAPSNTTLLQIPQLKADQYSSSQDAIECSANKTTIADIYAETSKKYATHQKFVNKKSYEGFGEDIITQYMQEMQRPYSPPLGQQRPGDSILQKETSPKIRKKKLELLYDPVLDCYYDCRAHTFYQLKK